MRSNFTLHFHLVVMVTSRHVTGGGGGGAAAADGTDGTLHFITSLKDNKSFCVQTKVKLFMRAGTHLIKLLDMNLL